MSNYSNLTVAQLIAAAETSSDEARRLDAYLRAAQHSITDLETHYKDACAQVEQLQRSNAAYIEANRESDRLNRAALAKKEKLKSELKGACEQRDMHIAAAKFAAATEHDAVAALDAAKKRSDELEAKYSVACAQADKFKSKHEAQVKARDALKLLYDTALRTVRELKGECKNAYFERDELKAKLGTAEQKIAALEAAKYDVEAVLEEAQDSNAELKAKCAAFEARDKTALSTIGELDIKCKELEAKLTESVKMHSEALCRIMQLEGQLKAINDADGKTANEQLVAINIELREKLHKALTAVDLEAAKSAATNTSAACAENFAHHETAIVKMCEQIRILQQAVFPASSLNDYRIVFPTNRTPQ